MVCARILLLCFIAGQFMVYAHQHPGAPVNAKQFAVSKTLARHQTIKEKCDLCDVMHNTAMLASYQVYLNPVHVAGHVYKTIGYNFTSTGLIAAGGRGPPSHQS